MALDTEPAPEVDLGEPHRSDDRSFLSWVAVVLALAALVLGFVAIGNLGGDDGGSAAATDASAATYLDIELGALKLVPNHLMAEPGHIIVRVKNTDTQVHNLTIGTHSTPDVQPRATVELDLGQVDAG